MKKLNVSIRIKICFVCCLLILTQGNELSQSGGITEFLPLKTGNIWVYRCSAFNLNPPCYCSRYFRIKIVGTNVINGKTYYQSQISIYTAPSCYGSCNNTGPLPFDSLLRVDSLSGKVLQYSAGSVCLNTPNELLLDSLKAQLHDTVWIYCQPPVQWNTYVCSDTSIITIFGQSRQSRRYSIIGFEGGWSRTYVKGIGISQSGLSNLWCPNQTNLLGCVINGIAYGDTTFITGINKISNEVPKSFSLYQNYPNPFNPTTKIRFALPALPLRQAGLPPSPQGEGLGVRVTIYDILGREIKTLVNEQLQPGTYEVDFDGTDYASGVYYYTLTAGNYIETRKMVLLR